MSAKATVVVVAAGIAFSAPLPRWLFSSELEALAFRFLVVAATIFVVVRDEFGLFRQLEGEEENSAATSEQATPQKKQEFVSKIKILYGSTTGNAKSLAMALRKRINTHTRKTTALVANLKDYEPEDLVNEECVAIIISTWNGGEPPKDAVFFDKFLTDTVLDFRRSKTMLEKVKFCVYGLGSSAYSEDVFCTASKRIHKSLLDLGAKPIAELSFGDDAQGDMDAEFANWVQAEVMPNFQQATRGTATAKSGTDATAKTTDSPKKLSKRQARLLRQKQNEARYGPSRAKIVRQAKKKEKMKPAPLQEEDLINDTFLSLPERLEQEEKLRQERAAKLAAGMCDCKFPSTFCSCENCGNVDLFCGFC